MKKSIYLDNSATTPVRPEVLEAIAPYSSNVYGNPSSIHHVGRQAKAAIEIARQKVANMLNAKPSEIYFTPSATYSNNVALLGRARYVEESGLGRHLITTGIEHSSALGPAKYLQSKGWRVTILDVDREGFVNEQALLQAITPETSIISIMWANNEVGTIQPITRFAQMAKERGIFFHTDAVQAAGKIEIDLSATPVDTLSISGHKFHAPKGIGALFIRDTSTILPITFGGGQEDGLFPGTEALTGIIALGAAAQLVTAELAATQKHLRKLQEIIISKITEAPHVTLTGPSHLDNRIPGHISVVVQGSTGEDLVETADDRGIYISSVSACSSNHPSHVLKQMGYSPEQGIGSARISASVLNTVEECVYAATALKDIFNQSHSFAAPVQAVMVA